MRMQISLLGYVKSHRTSTWTAEIPASEGRYRVELADGLCVVSVNLHKEGTLLTGQAEYTFTRSSPLAMAVAIEVTAESWSRENYVFAPGAVYNGNRFCCQKLPYPPYANVNGKDALTAPPIVTDIPRLSDTSPISRIELRSGDMTTPAIGFFSSTKNTGMLLLAKHIINGDYTGLSIYENLNEQKAVFALSCPAVREGTKYFFGERMDGHGFYPHSDAPSDDTGRWFRAKETVHFDFVLDCFSADNLHKFFSRFLLIRNTLEHEHPSDAVAYGTAYEAVKKKYQQENYIKEKHGGYYSVGVCRDIPQQCWQAGWIGGCMNGYTFMQEDCAQAKQRALETFRFVFDHLQNEHGWVCGMYRDGITYGDAFGIEHNDNTLLIRKDADLLYFAVKQYLLCQKELLGYRKPLMALADAFVRLYNRYGQIGQFIDTETENILIGNSACGAIAPAALALCSTAFNKKSYLAVAENLAELYKREYLDKGISNGAPGEICQAPDSESAFALLESYVQLYETTKKAHWLNAAKAACCLAMTWVMNYNFSFPPESAAAKRGILTTGTIFANAQNKHSAPGICTLSGNSLLKLYRFTGNDQYLNFLRCITRGLMQCVSLPERPIWTLQNKYLPEGYVNERCQTSDWEGKETIGGFLYGSNWPEVSVLLTYGEVPGIYVNLPKRKAFALDAVQCGLKGNTLWVQNTSAYETTVTVLLDNPSNPDYLTCNYFLNMQKVRLSAGQRYIMEL